MKVLLMFLVFIGSISAVKAQKFESKLIQENYDLYTKAMVIFDGAAAVDYVTNSTIEYYNSINQLIKHGDSIQVAHAPIMDRMLIFRIRHLNSIEPISFYSGRELFIYAITTGLIGKNSVRNIYLDKISIKGETAVATAKKGKENAGYFYFNKENNKWRMNLIPLIEETNSYLIDHVVSKYKSQYEFIHEMIQGVNQNTIDESVYWIPTQN